MYTQKKSDVDRIASEIEHIRETANLVRKEASLHNRDLQSDIMEANIIIAKLKENIAISKKCEENRLNIIRDKQKMFSDVVAKDKFVYF